MLDVKNGIVCTLAIRVCFEICCFPFPLSVSLSLWAKLNSLPVVYAEKLVSEAA